ncbi:MAG: LamG domain-containing protein, partial [Deltaproteobacteria bacterium]|nr:LamG domain-containing protein [Deltaproteobacteria bacterium]
MSGQKVLQKDPVGYQDWTLPVSIVGQVIEKLKVDIVAQTLANLKVDIAAQSLAELNVKLVASEVTLNVAITSSSVTLDVNVTNASLTVNIGAPLTDTGYLASSIVESVQLDVNIAASAVTLNVAITSSSVTLDVNVTNASLTVNIGGPLTTDGYVASEIVKSVQLDVNIAASAVTLNVAIKSSDVTLNVNVTNASLTVNIGGPLSTSGYVQTSIMESVQLDVNIAASAVTLNVAIKSSDVTLNVNVTNASLTVNIGGPVDANGYVQTHIMDSVQLDVNIAASAVTLNVAIQSSAVTLDVNIASSAVTMDINVTNPVLRVGAEKPCLAFDGVNDKVVVPPINTETYTVEVWLMTNVLDGAWHTAVGCWFTDHHWVHLGINNANQFSNHVFLDGESVGIVDTTTVIEVGRWYHLVAIVNKGDGKLELWVDGSRTVDIAKTWTTTETPGTNNIYISTRDGSANWWNGAIALVRIYSRALSESEIQHNYQNPQSPVTQGLVLWLNFDEGSGNVAHDKSGNGNDGTIYGATWVNDVEAPGALVNVNLSAQTVTMEVKIVASDVTLNVAIQSSAVTLDVNITGSSVTLDVNVVGTANVNITDAIVNISALRLMDEGTVIVKDGGTSVVTTLYTVPTGKKAYIYLAQLTVR